MSTFTEGFEVSQQRRVANRSQGQKQLNTTRDTTQAARKVVADPGYGNSMSALKYQNQIGRKDKTPSVIRGSKRLAFVSAGDGL